jgi:hypothetical protein
MTRRSIASCLTGAVAILAVSASAGAQEERQQVLYGKHRTFESPQNFAVELRFAPFAPDIDSDPALHGKTPFSDVFGSGPRLLAGLEFDWQVLRIPHLGTIGPGIGAGYTKMSGDAQFLQPHPLPTGGTTTTSGETTTLEIFPLYAVAVLRADVLWREVHVPLVPYAKAGIGYSIWRASNTLGTSSTNGVTGVGGSLGTELAVGVAFNLNVFDEYSAKTFDDAMGVNNTYVFGEYTRADLNGLGVQSDPLRVGGQSWTFGLAFEF